MKSSSISRRNWLKTAGVAAVGAGLGARCAVQPAEKKHAKVICSADRVIRTVAGLRPFRPSGFRLQAETFDAKTVIHNYGHGGGGMTMSWGCAHLAVEEALKAGEGPYAVIGCGALGLSSARLLQKKGLETTIYAKDLPPRTTSNIACASWYPAESSDPNKQTPEWTRQFMRAARLSYRYFQDYVGNTYGIRWLPNYTLSDEPMEDRGLDASDSPIRDLFPARADLAPDEHPFGSPYCRVNWTMMIETLIYLNAVLRDYRLAGGKVVVREFSNQEDVLSLPESVFINCTGIGAKALFEDEELMPIKGQLTVLLPQEEIDYITVFSGLYMMPRKDGILLGGTHERGEWSLEPNKEAIQRVVEGHIEFFERMA